MVVDNQISWDWTAGDVSGSFEVDDDQFSTPISLFIIKNDGKDSVREGQFLRTKPRRKLQWQW
jgi:hypothetical protein